MLQYTDSRKLVHTCARNHRRQNHVCSPFPIVQYCNFQQYWPSFLLDRFTRKSSSNSNHVEQVRFSVDAGGVTWRLFPCMVLCLCVCVDSDDGLLFCVQRDKKEKERKEKGSRCAGLMQRLFSRCACSVAFVVSLRRRKGGWQEAENTLNACMWMWMCVYV